MASVAFSGESCLQWSQSIGIFTQRNSLGILPTVRILSIGKQICLAWNIVARGPLQLSDCIFASCSSWDEWQRVWIRLVVMRRVLELEEMNGTVIISAASRSEFYRGPEIHAIVLYQELQTVYQGQDELVSPVSPQQSLLQYRPVNVAQHCCATWIDAAPLRGAHWLRHTSTSEAPSAETSEFSPVSLSVDDASPLVSWNSLSPKAAVCAE